jgi:serine phosphatase RsbU (regulator of sigma subunit)
MMTLTGHTTYGSRIQEAVQRHSDLLILDQINTESAAPAFNAAQKGVCVMAQMDTVHCGASIAYHLLDMGVTEEQLTSLTWIITVQRLPLLCPTCKQPGELSTSHRARLTHQFPDLQPMEAYYQAAGCGHCDNSGRYGDVIVFDIFHGDGASQPFEQASMLPMKQYILDLTHQGYLPIEEALDFETAQLHRTYKLFATSEHTLTNTNAALERKLAELENANHVLEQQTRALVTFQELGQALITSTNLEELAGRICRHANDLCGTDRAILYLRRSPERSEILAVNGWPVDLLHQHVSANTLPDMWEPEAYNHWPPGTLYRPPGMEGAVLRAGLYVPLIAQDRPVGVMIVHSTYKNRFEPGKVALLQTFAHQAALAIQRAELIDQLRGKIVQLEAAQVELAQKERMEREMELAREVQRSMLPRTFPAIPGYHFAGRNEPARQVGGDFYDVIALDEDHFGIAIADVSDKGMPAALYMALARSLLLSSSQGTLSPREVLIHVNNLLRALGEPNMFVTLFYGVVDRSTRQLTYTRAGHDRPVLLHDGSLQELGGRGMALGLLDRDMLSLTEEQIALAPGDRLVLYTDGLTDAPAPDGQLFDRARLKTLFQAQSTLPPGEFCATVFAHIAAYQSGAEQFDDMTMLVVAVE